MGRSNKFSVRANFQPFVDVVLAELSGVAREKRQPLQELISPYTN